MISELVIALWMGLGAVATAGEIQDWEVASARPVAALELTPARAGAVYEATRFSLRQVDAAHLLRGVARDAFVQALIDHDASATDADRSELRRLQAQWDQARTEWPLMSPDERRRFVHDVIAATYGEAIAGELITETTMLGPGTSGVPNPRP
jgi:hypothetical protein